MKLKVKITRKPKVPIRGDILMGEDRSVFYVEEVIVDTNNRDNLYITGRNLNADNIKIVVWPNEVKYNILEASPIEKEESIIDIMKPEQIMYNMSMNQIKEDMDKFLMWGTK